MSRWLGRLIALVLSTLAALSAGNAHAHTLLWLTADITPAARTAALERLGAAAGWQVRHLDHPLADTPALAESQRATLAQALTEADMVWIDTPHASVYTRLRTLHGAALDAHARAHPGRVLWIAPEPAGDSSKPAGDAPTPAGDAPTPADTAPEAATAAAAAEARLAAYVRAGGSANLGHAFTLATALVAGPTGGALPDLPPPRAWPARGLYHPDAADFFADASALAAWQADQPAYRARPAVAVLVHRYHFINGATDWLDDWLRSFERHGLFAYAVFGQRVDATDLAALLELPPAEGARAHPRVIVLHQLVPQAAALQPLFQRWGTPVLATQPYRQGDVAAWEQDANGLALGDTPFYLVQPEAAGSIDPLMVVAHAERGRRTVLIERQAAAVAAKARRLIALQQRAPADKRLVAMVYNYPPGGTNFGASFLNVPRSLEEVSGALAAAGYHTRATAEAAWVEQLPPLLRAYYPDADLAALLERDQAAALPLAHYEAWWRTLPAAVRTRIEAHWGPPAASRYVVRHQGEAVFVIPRLQIGKLAVLPQPPREETLRDGQSPFMHRSKAPLSHHYLAVYLWAQQADALIHFGTHGTQEWAPGKARALDVVDDALLPLGDLPVIYPYIVDNLGEALTAKRRGRALLISHRTPVFATTGFPARMAHLHELMHEWETADLGPTRSALEQQLVLLIVDHQFHRDLGWTQEQLAADLPRFMEALHPWLDQLAQSAQPKGLAVFGRAPDEAERRQIILQALRKPLLDALGEDIDETFLIEHRAVADSRPARWLALALHDTEAASALDLRPPEPASAVPNRAARRDIDRAALRELGERAQHLDRLLATEGEIDGLLTALDGRFVAAAYGGDPLRNPESLPTGRNLTGLDPSRLPTRQAYNVARLLFKNWLDDWLRAHPGQPPQRLALSLWAGEALRHQGIIEAQALVALGVRPVWDDAGRPRTVELIPAAELGRPRVDVLLSVTGSYRDQFPALMALLDDAVATVAAAEPEGVIARHSREVAAELRQHGVPAAQAQVLGQARVFGNAHGDYGTGLSEAVQDNGLRAGDERLGELFLQRMSQPYLGGNAVSDLPAGAAARALGAQLRRTDAALLSRTSHLYGMASSDDPFQYLGGLAAAARSAGNPRPLALFVNQLQDDSEPFTESAQRSIAMEMQTRYLHPAWLEAQKAEGYAGTLQVLKSVQFIWGWQATVADSVRPDHWQSFYDVLVRDKHQLGLPEWLRSHPQAYAQALERLIQARRHGHWNPDAETSRNLAQMYDRLTRDAPLAQELPAVRQWVHQALWPQGRVIDNAAKGLARHTAATPAQPAPATLAASPDTPAPPTPTPATPPLQRGVLLQRQEAEPPPPQPNPLFTAFALFGMFAVIGGGALRQRARGRGQG